MRREFSGGEEDRLFDDYTSWDDSGEDLLSEVPEEFKKAASRYMDAAFQTFLSNYSPEDDLRAKLLSLALYLDLVKDWERLTVVDAETALKDRRTLPLTPDEERELRLSLIHI